MKRMRWVHLVDMIQMMGFSFLNFATVKGTCKESETKLDCDFFVVYTKMRTQFYRELRAWWGSEGREFRYNFAVTEESQ